MVNVPPLIGELEIARRAAIPVWLFDKPYMFQLVDDIWHMFIPGIGIGTVRGAGAGRTG
jgi:hypothetical protein